MTSRLPKLIASALVVAALAVAGCGDSYNSPTMPTPGASGNPSDVVISVARVNGVLSFSPNPAMVQAGQTVSWYVADLDSHVVIGDGGAFSTEEVPYLGTSKPIGMDVLGTYTYRLQGSPTVVGTLIVTQ